MELFLQAVTAAAQVLQLLVVVAFFAMERAWLKKNG
jgi:hypothetical protein